MTQNSEHTPAPADVDPTVAEIAEDIVTEDAAPVAPEQTFADFGVHPAIVEALEAKGIVHPFPIQAMTLPVALGGHDIIGQAKTGTGKTLGFGIPALQRAIGPGEPGWDGLEAKGTAGAPQALIVAPTRELAVQVAGDLTAAAARRPLRIATIYGGRAYEPQIEELQRGVEIVVGTPGRLIDLMRQRHLRLDLVNTVVLDEADEMLDLGFLPDVETLLAAVPAVRQTMLFSATMPGPVVAMARRYMTQPTHIRAADPEDEGLTKKDIRQLVYRAHHMDKDELVARALQAEGRGRTIIFTRTKRTAARVADETEKVLTLARVHAALYEAAKRAQGALDFTDLVGRTVELLTKRATAAWVLYKLDGGIEHVLIDEAQDTAPDQWAIVRALTEPFFAGSGAERRDAAIPRTVFAVGDEKQSIYSFQGARPERLRQEARTYDALVREAGADFREVPLDTSFRSTEEVLQFVDLAFDCPERTRALVGETGDIAIHRPARLGQHGSVELWPLFEDPVAPEREAWNAPVDKEDNRSARKQLAQALAREIKQQVEDGTAVWTHDRQKGPVRRPVRYGDFLVLVRRRDATFEEIIRALKTEGVPVAGADRLKLSSHIVFDDLIALARFALLPDDDLSLAEILRSPFCDVTDFGDPHSLYPLADKVSREGRTLWRELQRRAHEQPAWTAARDLMMELIAARGRDPFAFFSTALNRVGPDGRSGRARILERLGREAEEAIDETLAQVLAAEERGGRDLETCLALLEQADVEVKREMEGVRDEVRVMTVHGSKGLEAPVVILPDTTGKAKPQGPTLMSVALPDAAEAWLMCPSSAKADCGFSSNVRKARGERTDAESLRLLYVALTRARDRLIIMGRKTRSPKEGFEAGSWWDVIAGTFECLARTRPDAVRTLDGGRLRFGVDPERTPRTEPVATEAARVPDWAASPPPPDDGARFASPSRMEGSIRVPAPSPLARSAAGGASLGRFRRGDLVHRLLERLPEIAPAARPDAARRLLARETDLDEAQRAEMIAAAFSVLNDARFAPVFGEGSRAEVALTGSAPGLPAGVAINGRIDRLVVTPERILVIDYKTNRPAPDTIDRVDPAYVLQAAAYVAVLKRLYPDRRVEAALVWTDGPKLMPIPEKMLEAALAGGR